MKRLHRPNIELFTGPTDIFHASDWAQPPTSHAKIVATVHDITPVLFPQHHHPKVVAAFNRRMHWVTQEADAIITDSDATKSDLINHYSVDPNKVTTIYLAASPDFSSFTHTSKSQQVQAVQAVVRRHQIQTPYFLSVGTREPRKNLSRTIQAFARFAQSDNQNHSLVVAGKYGWGQDLQHLPEHIQQRIHLLGFVPQEELPALYSGASALVYPSLYEGFGLPVLEAMTLGVPVITSKRGSLGEVAGRATVLVDPESAVSIEKGIHQVLAEPKKLIQLGIKQAAKFSWQKTALQTLKVYQVLNEK